MVKPHRIVYALMLAGILLLLGITADAQVFNAQSDIYSVLKGACRTNLNVMTNDNADSLVNPHVIIISFPLHGFASVDSNTNLVTYCADSFFTGAVNFKYIISDASHLDSARVYINVVNGNSLVYAGDADQNGRIDNYDVLKIGLAYQLAGPSRNSAASFTSLAWSPSPYLNSNPGAADCNGDGIVDTSDMQYIENGYHDTVPFVNYVPVDTSECKPNGIPFYFQSLWGDTVLDGDTMEVLIKLGQDSTLTEAYGIAFTLEFDNGLIPGNGISYVTSSSWMLQSDAGIFFKRSFQSSGEIEMALTKTNHTAAHGSGEILKLRIPIDDNIDGIITAPGAHLLNLKLSKVRMVSENEVVRDICVQQPNFILNKKASGIPTLNDDKLKIYPSPSNGKIVVEADNINRVEVTDLMGRKIYSLQANATNKVTIDMQPLDLANGAYFIKVETQQSVYTKQIFIQR